MVWTNVYASYWRFIQVDYGDKILHKIVAKKTVGVFEIVFTVWFSGEHGDGLKRGVKYNNIANTTAHNVAYAVKLRTEHEHHMYLIFAGKLCSGCLLIRQYLPLSFKVWNKNFWTIWINYMMLMVFSCITGKNTVLQLSLVTPEMPRTAAVVTKFSEPLLGHRRTLRVENMYNSPDLAK